MSETRSKNPVLLYDGQCGMCTDGVQRVLRHDHQGTLRFAPLQGTFAATVKARHPELDSVDSMVWVEPAGDGSEQLFIRSSAGLRIARYLGGFWTVLLVAHLVPRSWRDALYDFVARHRHTIAGRSDHCLVPTPETRSRFLE
jgi:predicted DCC family thiol-disulfide oxidoreductase YuxK